MAGHSQFKNIMYRKGAQDKKRAKVFTKIIREITAAARTGADPDANPRLRSALIAARGANMPKDTMVRAIKRGAGGEADTQYEEIRYEGYGPGGVAIIVEVLTDNRNRTAPEVRAAFTKYNGNMGETNSVASMFDHKGLVTYPANIANPDKVLEAAIEAGATDVESGEQIHEIFCEMEDLNAVREYLSKIFGDPESAKLVWVPKTTTSISGEAAQQLFKLIETLEDNDDVQAVSANYEVSDEVLREIAAK